ncbi:phage late control D family protein [Perlucidibaca piscinae]|uniref:phage late control D family protein n=1 Tax=Perlucidibaca piscinae TaxID=392589 RepID=UPI001B7FDA7E|nr:phage late control D family protein [Perlucidibaca piscinae]
MPKPAYQISLAGEDISARVQGRLISLTLTDNRGLEADQLDLTISDSDGKLAMPSKGVKLQLAIGWQGSPLVDKGTFTVDEVRHSGAPDQLTIRARSANLCAGLRVKRERSWHNTTLGAIVKSIAATNGLKVALTARLASIVIKHLDQTSESDVNLLTRLCKDHGAIASIKADRLVVFPSGQAATVSGREISPAIITRADGDEHEYGSSDRDAYTGVMAYWLEASTGRKREVIAGDEENLKTLRHTYATEQDAMTAAVAEMGRIQRAAATFTLDLAVGRPELYPETPLIVSGWKPEIDGQAWIAVKLVHSITDSGFTTKVEAEVFSAESSHSNDSQLSGVRARWIDSKTGKRSLVLAGKEGNVQTLSPLYTNRAIAKTRANAALRQAQQT